MVNVLANPVQVADPFTSLGVTVMVAINVVLPVLVAVNELILPLPLAGNPMDVLSLVQV